MGDRDNAKRPLDGGGDYGGAKRARPSRRMSGGGGGGGGGRVELRLLIPISSAGAIIGKGGTNIKDLRQEYNANIQIPDSRGVERVVNTSAFNIDDLSRLCGRIVECVHSERPHSKTQEVRVLVHKSQAGTIIGTKGFKIKELRETTGAAIKVFQDCCPNSTDRICQIRGDNHVITDCVKLILDLLETAPPKGPIQRYDPNCLQMGNMEDMYDYGGYDEEEYGGGRMGGGRFGGGGGRGRDNMYGGGHERRGFQPRGGGRGRGRGGGYGNMGGGNFGGPRGGGGSFYGGGNDYSSDSYGGGGYGNYGQSNTGSYGGGGRGGGGPETTTKVTIPTSLAGSIIGKRGQRIRQIRQDCGAQIKIDEPAPGSNDRIITITGTQEQIQNAQYLLQQSVKMHSGEKF